MQLRLPASNTIAAECEEKDVRSNMSMRSQRYGSDERHDEDNLYGDAIIVQAKYLTRERHQNAPNPGASGHSFYSRYTSIDLV
jgi:hypothetical protein